MTLYAGLDLGCISTLAVLELNGDGWKVVNIGQVDLGEHDKKNPAQDLARKLMKLSRFVKSSLIDHQSIRKLLIEEPPLVRNVKVYKYLCAYYGACLVAAANCGNVVETETAVVSSWRKRLDAVVTFKKDEYTADMRTKIVKKALAIQVEAVTGLKFKASEHDKADGVGLAIAASR